MKMDDVEPAAGKRVQQRQNVWDAASRCLVLICGSRLISHAAVAGAAGLGVRRARVDRDVVPPAGEMCRQLLDRALDAAVGGGHTAQADHRDRVAGRSAVWPSIMGSDAAITPPPPGHRHRRGLSSS